MSTVVIRSSLGGGGGGGGGGVEGYSKLDFPERGFIQKSAAMLEHGKCVGKDLRNVLKY